MKEHDYDWEKWSMKLENCTLKGEIKDLKSELDSVRKDRDHAIEENEELKKKNERLKLMVNKVYGRVDIHSEHSIKLYSDVKDLYSKGYSFAQMAKMTGVNICTVINIVNSIDENDKDNTVVPSWLKAVREHDEKIDELKADLDNAYTDLDIVQDKMKTIEADLDDCKRRYFNDKQELQEQLDKDFDDVYTEFSNVKDSVNDINFGYIKWSAEVSQFDERIEKLEELNKNTECIAVNTNCLCGQLEKKVNKFDERLDDYKEAYMHLNNADEAFDRRIKVLEDNMKEIANNGGLGLSFNLMNARIVDNKHRNEELTRRLDALEASIHKLEEAFSEVADDTTLNTSVNEKLDEKVTKLQDDLLENTKVIADLAENNIKNRKLEKEIRGIKTRLESDEEIFDSQSNRINKMQDDINAAHQNLVHQADRTNANITSLIDLESRVKTLENASKKTAKKND